MSNFVSPLDDLLSIRCHYLRCKIGAGAVVAEGSVMDEGAQIASGTVVPPGCLVPKNELWAGNPAK